MSCTHDVFQHPCAIKKCCYQLCSEAVTLPGPQSQPQEVFYTAGLSALVAFYQAIRSASMIMNALGAEECCTGLPGSGIGGTSGRLSGR